MSRLTLVPGDEAVLHAPTTPVDQDTIETPSFQKLLDEMIHTMYEENGIGLAATQIGKDLCVATLVPDPERFDFYDKGSREGIVIINPKITGHSLRSASAEEGCLSVPGYMGLVKRYKSVNVTFTDRHGQKQHVKAHGLLAQVYQHEIDHLHGTLFVDKAERIYKIHRH